MKGPKPRNNNRKRPPRNDTNSWSRIFWCTIFIFFNFLLLSGFTFSTFRLLFGKTFRPGLLLRWPTVTKTAVTADSPVTISVREVVMLPDQSLVFLNYPRTGRLFTKEDIDCIYYSANDLSSRPLFKQPPLDMDGEDPYNQIIRCPLQSGHGFRVSVGLKQNGDVTSVPTYTWDSLAYDAVIDHDNTTVVFVKGLNLRPDRVSNASRYECLYGWDFSTSNHLLRSDVVSLAQEIVRCKTPLSVLIRSKRGVNDAVKVSVRLKGRTTIVDTIARPGLRPGLVQPPRNKEHVMCICSMVRNQGRFLKEWVMYHAEMGVQRWFIYDNNSDDETDVVIELLQSGNYNITRHLWPWIKTQEAGFAHCALRARETCQWVGFIDVDEFFHMPSLLLFHDVLRNQSKYGYGEVQAWCYSFGPSGLKSVPIRGVTVGYTCRVAVPERHKSIVKPEALDSTLMNVVHHFKLTSGYEAVKADRGVLVINHYKYQVWEVFKEKFYRRVATYVADWQEEQNVGSKDRAPGLGTKAVEPPDWPERFCEVNDTGLRNRVLKNLADPYTRLLPWQEGYQKHEKRRVRRRKRKRRKHRGYL
ncbi:glycosyltransferase family 92 protein [Rosa sericea]